VFAGTRVPAKSLFDYLEAGALATSTTEGLLAMVGSRRIIRPARPGVVKMASVRHHPLGYLPTHAR